MRIALVIERFAPRAGGAERSSAQIAAELVRRGHEVTVITSWSPEWDAEDGLQPSEIVPGVSGITMDGSTRSAIGLIAFSKWAKARLDEGGYDVSLSVTMAVPANVLQPRGGTVKETLERTVATRRSSTDRAIKRAFVATSPKYITQLAIERKTLADPRVRRIVAVSRYVADQLHRHYAIDPGRVEVIPNAAVMPTVDAETRAGWRRAVRSAFAVPDDAVAYLFLARNARLKGFDPLLAAARGLEARGVKSVLLLAGDIYHPQQAAVARLDLRDDVRFIRHTNTSAALFAASDVTVLPTFYDPSSKVVIESLMMGVPAISTRYNGASDFLLPEDGPPRGIVVGEPWDVAGLTEAMVAMADPQTRAGFARAAEGLADELSMSRHVDRLEQVLRAAAAEPTPAPDAAPAAAETAS